MNFLYSPFEFVTYSIFITFDFSTVWRFEKKKYYSFVEVKKPTEDELYLQKEALGEIQNYAEEHPLNTVSKNYCGISFDHVAYNTN